MQISSRNKAPHISNQRLAPTSRILLHCFLLTHTAEGHWQYNPYANGLPLYLMSTNTNFVYVNDGQACCAHTDRCTHKRARRHVELYPGVVKYNLSGERNTKLVSSCVWLPLHSLDRDIWLFIKTGLAWILTPC